MADGFDTVLEVPDLGLEEQVDAFRTLARDSKRQKRLAGRRLHAWLRRNGKKSLLRHFLLAFNVHDTEYSHIRFTGGKARHAN